MPLYAFSPYLPLLLIFLCNEGRHRAAKHEEPCLSYALSVYHYFVFQVKSRRQKSQFLSNGSQFSSTCLCCIFLVKTNFPKVFSPQFFRLYLLCRRLLPSAGFHTAGSIFVTDFVLQSAKKTIDKYPEYWYTYRVEEFPVAQCVIYIPTGRRSGQVW